MAAYKSLQMTTPKYPVSGPGIGGRSVKTERGTTIVGTAYAVADTVTMLRLHPRFRVTGGYVKTDGMGTSVTAIVGDAGDDDRYFVSAAVATAGINTTMAATGLDYLTTAYTDVIVKFAGATANGTGTITLVIFGYIEEPA
jgi:hypothetical protein